MNIGDFLLKPKNIQINIDMNTITLTWDKVIGAESYIVYFSTEPDSEFEEVVEGDFTYDQDTVSWTKTLDQMSHKLFFEIKAFSETRNLRK